MRIALSSVKSSPRPWVNPFPRALLPPTTRLSQLQLTQLSDYVKASATYEEREPFFESCDPDSLIHFAAAYYLPKTEALEIKIQKISGLTRKQFEFRVKKLQEVAAEIERLNKVPLPGVRTSSTGLLAELATSEATISEMEESLARADRFDNLPCVLLEYSRALKQWPHPTYRRSLSERNPGFRLAQLCLFVRAMTSGSHYREIASLLNAVAEFAWEKLHERHRSPMTHDLIGHNVKNFRDRNPEIWLGIERLAMIAAKRYREDRVNEKNLPRQTQGARSSTKAL